MGCEGGVFLDFLGFACLMLAGRKAGREGEAGRWREGTNKKKRRRQGQKLPILYRIVVSSPGLIMPGKNQSKAKPWAYYAGEKSIKNQAQGLLCRGKIHQKPSLGLIMPGRNP